MDLSLTATVDGRLEKVVIRVHSSKFSELEGRFTYLKQRLAEQYLEGLCASTAFDIAPLEEGEEVLVADYHQIASFSNLSLHNPRNWINRQADRNC